MEYAAIANLSQKICRIGLGTWAMGGHLWGGSDEKQALHTIHKAFDLGINLVDTAPIYGFGLSETLVGKALKSYGQKDNILIATKVGLSWHNKTVTRDSSKKRIFLEVEDSLKRLQVDKIDLYQIHWPDLHVPFSETAEALRTLLEQGKIRALAVSNFTKEMLQKFKKYAPISALQSPYNIFETAIDQEELPFCKEKNIPVIGYGMLCRGLLSGKITRETKFKGDDLRKTDPKFQEPLFSEYLECVDKLKKWVQYKYCKSIAALAARYVLDNGVDFPLWGARKPEQLDVFNEIWGWKLTEEDLADISTIVIDTISHPVGPEFMEPSKEHKVTV